MGNIIYEDKDIIVYFKEAGENSEALPSVFDTKVFVIHRLDMPVSGIMVLGKTKKAADFLGKELQANRINKIYVAQVDGPIDDEGELKDFIFHDKMKNKTFIVKSLRKGAKEAELYYKVIERTDNLSTVRIKLKTGRTHQIRIQFASRKNPLVGDGKYGSRIKGNIRLCASELDFIHPVTGENMHFEVTPFWMKK